MPKIWRELPESHYRVRHIKIRAKRLGEAAEAEALYLCALEASKMVVTDVNGDSTSPINRRSMLKERHLHR